MCARRSGAQLLRQTRGLYFRIVESSGVPCASPGDQKFAVFIDIRKLFRHPVMLSDEHALGAML